MFEEISPTREELVQATLLHAADDDYICARACARIGLYRHFSWNAAQAIEKYLKCALVLHGKSVKDFNHSISSLAIKIEEVLPDAFPAEIRLDSIKVRKGFECHAAPEPFFDCIKRFEENGHTSGRYNQKDLHVAPYDLQRLDALTYYLRPLCRINRGDESDNRELPWRTIVHEEADASKREYLHWENVFHTSEDVSHFKGWFFSAHRSAPANAGILTGRVSEHDLDWFHNQVK